MKKFILFLCTMCAAVSFAQTAVRPISTQAVLSYAKQFCNDTNGDYDYYLGKSKKVIDGMSYFYVFVDQEPGAGWEHQCKHLYINAIGVSAQFPVIASDATHPFGDVKMSALSVKKRNDGISIKPKVLAGASNGTNNSYADKTYAVIVSGGINMNSNAERYWNDCSFLYQTLRKRYNVPKKNIKVVMADGTDPSEDMLTEAGVYISSPLDLDDDGVADIEYSATKDNVVKVIKGMASKMTDDDHLFIYFIDHGGFDKGRNQSYVCLWNGDKLYPEELKECLQAGDAGYIDILMGQCHSGGFVDALKGNNRIVATACKENELSYAREDLMYDEFVYHWTSAINGYDADGNEVSLNKGTNERMSASVLNAFEYAKANDMYADNKFPYASETPCVSYLKESTIESLAMDTIPPTVYLCMSTGNTKIDYSSFVGVLDLFFSDDVSAKRCFWDSGDIWLRNEDDGLENQIHERPNVSEDHPDVYIYARIKNKGVKEYKGGTEKLTMWWARSALVIDRLGWLGLRGEQDSGGEVTNVTIRQHILPGESYVNKKKFTFSDDYLDYAMQKGFNMCLLAFLHNTKENPSIPTTDGGIAKAWSTDRLAQKNVHTFTSEFRHEITDFTMIPALSTDVKLGLLLWADSINSDSQDTIDVRLTVPTLSSHGSLSFKGFATNTVMQEFSMTDRYSVVSGMSYPSGKRESINLAAHYVANKDLSEKLNKRYDMAVVDLKSGDIIGGETFYFEMEPRPAILPQIEETIVPPSERILAATNINESVSYEWLDQDGNILGTDSSLKIGWPKQDKTFTLHVTANSDGAVNTASYTVKPLTFVGGLYPIDGKIVDVSFNYPADKDMSAKVGSVTTPTVSATYSIPEGSMKESFLLPSFGGDILEISIYEKEKITETFKFFRK